MFVIQSDNTRFSQDLAGSLTARGFRTVVRNTDNSGDIFASLAGNMDENVIHVNFKEKDHGFSEALRRYSEDHNIQFLLKYNEGMHDPHKFFGLHHNGGYFGVIGDFIAAQRWGQNSVILGYDTRATNKYGEGIQVFEVGEPLDPELMSYKVYRPHLHEWRVHFNKSINYLKFPIEIKVYLGEEANPKNRLRIPDNGWYYTAYDPTRHPALPFSFWPAYESYIRNFNSLEFGSLDIISTANGSCFFLDVHRIPRITAHSPLFNYYVNGLIYHHRIKLDGLPANATTRRAVFGF